MPFGNKAGFVIAQVHGIGEPYIGLDAIWREHRHRTDLWNGLVAIEQSRREEVWREALERDDLTLDLSSDDRSRIAPLLGTKDDPKKFHELIETLPQPEHRKAREAASRLERAVWRAARQNEAWRDFLLSSRRLAYIRGRDLVRNSPALYLNSEDVFLSWMTASMRQFTPRFRPLDNRSGSLFVKWGNGVHPSKLFDKGTMNLKIVPTPPDAPKSSRHWSRAPFSIVFRVGNDPETGETCYAWARLEYAPRVERPNAKMRKCRNEWYGIIKTARLVWDTVADRTHWKIVFTIETQPPQPTSCGRRVAIDFAWRRRPSGLRVAYLLSEDGSEDRELVLDNRWLEGMRLIDRLRQTRDDNRNAVLEQLTSWAEGLGENRPPWLDPGPLSQTRSYQQLRRLLAHWRLNRFEGDGDGYEILRSWLAQDRHLWRWQENQRRTLIGRRKALYCSWAKQLVQRYGEIVIEKVDLNRLARKGGSSAQKTAQQKAIEVAMRRQRFIASPHLLRQAIENAARKAGVRVREVRADYTTRDCTFCGYRETSLEFDKAKELYHVCSLCQLLDPNAPSVDQDRRACENLLTRAAEEPSEG